MDRSCGSPCEKPWLDDQLWCEMPAGHSGMHAAVDDGGVVVRWPNVRISSDGSFVPDRHRD